MPSISGKAIEPLKYANFGSSLSSSNWRIAQGLKLGGFKNLKTSARVETSDQYISTYIPIKAILQQTRALCQKALISVLDGSRKLFGGRDGFNDRYRSKFLRIAQSASRGRSAAFGND
jgi:hypothetical protein